MRKFQTVRDLVELFQKHENTIRRWIIVDRIFPNAFRVKDGWYVPASDVQRVMRSGRIEESGAKAQRAGARGGFVTSWRS